MRDRIIIIAALLFIAACALITFARIESQYSPADYLVPSPAPLVPTATATASATAAVPASATPRPRRTATVIVTTTLPPSVSGEDGP
jgi:Zn-dependent protease with chaperone function